MFVITLQLAVTAVLLGWSYVTYVVIDNLINSIKVSKWKKVDGFITKFKIEHLLKDGMPFQFKVYVHYIYEINEKLYESTQLALKTKAFWKNELENVLELQEYEDEVKEGSLLKEKIKDLKIDKHNIYEGRYIKVRVNPEKDSKSVIYEESVTKMVIETSVCLITFLILVCTIVDLLRIM